MLVFRYTRLYQNIFCPIYTANATNRGETVPLGAAARVSSQFKMSKGFMLCRLAATVMLAPSGDLQLPNNFVFDRRKFLMGLATATAAPDPALDSISYSPFSNFLNGVSFSCGTAEKQNVQASLTSRSFYVSYYEKFCCLCSCVDDFKSLLPNSQC